MDTPTSFFRIELGELSAAVGQLISGAPGIDGLTIDFFFKFFWTSIGPDFYEVLKECYCDVCLEV